MRSAGSNFPARGTRCPAPVRTCRLRIDVSCERVAHPLEAVRCPAIEPSPADHSESRFARELILAVAMADGPMP